MAQKLFNHKHGDSKYHDHKIFENAASHWREHEAERRAKEYIERGAKNE